MSEPSHNLNALLIGTGEFSFAEDAETPAAALLAGYMDFGNIRALTPTIEAVKQVHKGSYRGKLVRDRTLVTEQNIDYIIRCDEWKKSNLLALFGGSETTEFTQAVLTAQVCDALAFTVGTPSDPDKWYQITNAGVAVMHVTTVTITALVEGTDFEVDTKLGRLRFLTPQTASKTPTVTADAILTGGDHAMHGITPFGNMTRRGIGRLVLFDQNADSDIVFDHREFLCEVTVENGGEINGENWSEIQLRVSVSAETPGTIYARQNLDD